MHHLTEHIARAEYMLKHLDFQEEDVDGYMYKYYVNYGTTLAGLVVRIAHLVAGCGQHQWRKNIVALVSAVGLPVADPVLDKSCHDARHAGT